MASDYIVHHLTEMNLSPYGADSFKLPYSSSELRFTNIVGEIPGENPHLDPLLLGAHYDTFDRFPGADDNAAAVAVLLRVAEELLKQHRERSILIAFFDAEEPPHFLQPTMGSIEFYDQQLLRSVHAAIILDLVGHDLPVKGMEDLIFLTGAESSLGVESAIRRCEPKFGLRTVPTLNSYVGDLSDHHIFRANDHPYVFLTCGRWQHYHSITDTPDKLNFDKLAEVAGYVLTLSEEICISDLCKPSIGDGTLETEIYFLEKNIVPALGAMNIFPVLDSRSDIDNLVHSLITGFDL
jgi:Zn-dependent M28 family amino/carboxypeptidase